MTTTNAPTMTTQTVHACAEYGRQEMEVYQIQDGPVTYFAMIDPYPTGNARYDGCGTGTLTFGHYAGMEFEPCHDVCAHHYADDVKRLEDAYGNAWEHDGRKGSHSPHEAMYIAAQRAGIPLATIRDGHYGARAGKVESARDLERAEVIVIGSRSLTGAPAHVELAYEDTLNHVAEINNQTWLTGAIPTHLVGKDGDPRDGGDVMGGTIWANVDEDGDSAPTTEELLEHGRTHWPVDSFEPADLTPKPAPVPVPARKYGWTDFEEDQSTDHIPGKYILTICHLNDKGEEDGEVATITHRATENYPYGGELMQKKRETAELIVNALNAYTQEN